MFDVSSKLAMIGQQEKETLKPDCAVLYRTPAVLDLIDECVRFEGMGGVSGFRYSDDLMIYDFNDKIFPLMFIEVGEDVENHARLLRFLMSHESRVVLIGSRDTITVERTVHELGFYYLLWPARKQDIAAFLRELKEDQGRNHGPHLSRAAMRIGVVASKGGVGCTLVATELVHTLVHETHKKAIIVDHNYEGSSMPVLLGKRELSRRYINDQGGGHSNLGHLLDQVGAQNQLSRIDSNVSYLGLASEHDSDQALWEYNCQLLSALSRDANFIVEDYSASISFYPDLDTLCTMLDCILVVIHPSLSGISLARDFLKKLYKQNEAQAYPARIILLLNHTRPHEAIDRKEVERFLGQPVDIELAYMKHCEELLVAEKRLYSSCNPLAAPMINLTRRILGKPAIKLSLLDRIKAFW